MTQSPSHDQTAKLHNHVVLLAILTLDDLVQITKWCHRLQYKVFSTWKSKLREMLTPLSRVTVLSFTYISSRDYSKIHRAVKPSPVSGHKGPKITSRMTLLAECLFLAGFF